MLSCAGCYGDVDLRMERDVDNVKDPHSDGMTSWAQIEEAKYTGLSLGFCGGI